MRGEAWLPWENAVIEAEWPAVERIAARTGRSISQIRRQASIMGYTVKFKERQIAMRIADDLEARCRA